MTEQIVIKLNKEKFEPVLKKLNNSMHNVVGSNSEMAAICILGMERICFEKPPELKGKTCMELILKERGKTFEDCVFEMLEKKESYLKK